MTGPKPRKARYYELRDSGLSHEEAVQELSGVRVPRPTADVTAQPSTPKQTVGSRLIRGEDILTSPDARQDAPKPEPPKAPDVPILTAGRPKGAEPAQQAEVTDRALSFETGSQPLRLARSAERGVGMALSGLGLRQFGQNIARTAVPRPEQMTPAETATQVGSTLLTAGAVGGGAARLGSAVLRKAGAGAVPYLFPEAGAGFGERVVANYLGAGSGPLLDLADAVSEPGIEEKAKRFAVNTGMSLAGAGAFEALASTPKIAASMREAARGEEGFFGPKSRLPRRAPPEVETRGAVIETELPPPRAEPEIPKAPEVEPSAARVEPPVPPKAPPATGEAPTPDDLRSAKAREYLNVPRFAQLDDRLKGVLEDKVLESAQKSGRVPKEKIPWSTYEEEAQRILATNRERLFSLDPERMTPAEDLAAATVVQSNIQEQARLASAVAGEADEAVRNGMLAHLESLDDEVSRLVPLLMRGRSEKGRAFNALKQIAGLTDAPPYWHYKASKHAGRALTDAERAEITRLLGAGKRGEMLRYAGGLRRKGPKESILETGKANLLDNPQTHIVNFTGNTTMAISEQLARQPAALADWFIAKAGGTTHRTKATGFNLGWKALKEGLREAADVMRGLPVGDDLTFGRIDPHAGTTGNRLVDLHNKIVFRLLQAGDRIFYRTGYRSDLAESAAVLANMEGLKGEARKARIQELILNPTDEMALRADAVATARIFQDETAIGNKLKAIAGKPGSLWNIPVPFARTPGSIATKTAEYSPLGFFGGGYKAAKAVKELRRIVKAAKPVTPELAALQRAAAETLGRATVGSIGYMAAGAYLYRNGLASGTVDPEDRAEQQTRYLADVPNDAIRIPGTQFWIEPARLGLPAIGLLMGAAMAQAAEETGEQDPLTIGGQVLGTYLRTLSDQTFFRGLDETLTLARNPLKYGGEYLAGLSSWAVPSIVRATARATDPQLRDTKGLANRVKSYIPGVSRTLPARVDQLGETVDRPAPGFLNNMVTPFRIQRDRLDDPLIQDIYESGATIGGLQRGVIGKGYLKGLIPSKESNQAYADRSKVVGRVLREQLEAVRQQPGYAEADPEMRAEVFEKRTGTVRGQATRAAKQWYAELRDSGMTHEQAVEEVQRRWQEMATR